METQEINVISKKVEQLMKEINETNRKVNKICAEWNKQNTAKYCACGKIIKASYKKCYKCNAQENKNKCACGKPIKGDYKQCYTCSRSISPELESLLESAIARRCTKCHGPLVSVGNNRKNGKDHKDWGNRTMHKSCWKDSQLDIRLF